MILVLLVLGILSGMVAFVYYGWQAKDMDGVSGREGISRGQFSFEYVDLESKLRNALNAYKEVTITEAQLNLYIAKKLKMSQGGYFKDFAKVKGVYVDLKPGEMEIFIEREIAQYAHDGKIKTDVFKPFTHTVSMTVTIAKHETKDGKKGYVGRIPGGFIGNAPAPNSLVTLIKPSFDQIHDHFKTELDLGYHKMRVIKVEEGKLVLDPRPGKGEVGL